MRKLTVILCLMVGASCNNVEDAKNTEHAGHSADAQTLAVVMRGLSVNMDNLMAGLWAEDWPRVALEAKAIADHPHVSDAEKKRIIGILGEEFGAFVGHDKVVHGAAVRLNEAATAKDRDAIVKELSVVQGGCVSCHSAFRERLKAPPAASP